MNMLRFELRSLVRPLIVWTASLIGLYLFLMLGFYDMFMDGRDAVMQAFGGLPPYFMGMFGMKLDGLFTFGGFFQFAYTYVGLVGAIMAAQISLHAFAREKRLKCADFILTKPVSRGRIFLMKLLACGIGLAGSSLLFLAACALSWKVNGAGEPLQRLMLAGLSLPLTQLVFLVIGALVSILAKKVRSVSGIGTAIGLAGFLAMALTSLLEEDFLRHLSPLQYFTPGEVFEMGRFDGRYGWTGALAAILSLALAYALFVGRDVRAV